MNLGVERGVLIQCRRGLFQPAVRILLLRAIESYWIRFLFVGLGVGLGGSVGTGRHRIGGERGGKGGAMRGAKNSFGATPYFLVIAEDQEG